MVRGLAWSGAGPVTNVEVSINCGESWHAAHIEEPRDRWMWVRWSYLWNAKTAGEYSILARATDAVGRVQSPEPRYNNMLKNFSAIVPYPVTIK